MRTPIESQQRFQRSDVHGADGANRDRRFRQAAGGGGGIDLLLAPQGRFRGGAAVVCLGQVAAFLQLGKRVEDVSRRGLAAQPGTNLLHRTAVEAGRYNLVETTLQDGLMQFGQHEHAFARHDLDAKLRLELGPVEHAARDPCSGNGHGGRPGAN